MDRAGKDSSLGDALSLTKVIKSHKFLVSFEGLGQFGTFVVGMRSAPMSH